MVSVKTFHICILSSIKTDFEIFLFYKYILFSTTVVALLKKKDLWKQVFWEKEKHKFTSFKVKQKG